MKCVQRSQIDRQKSVIFCEKGATVTSSRSLLRLRERFSNRVACKINRILHGNTLLKKARNRKGPRSGGNARVTRILRLLHRTTRKTRTPRHHRNVVGGKARNKGKEPLEEQNYGK